MKTALNYFKTLLLVALLSCSEDHDDPKIEDTPKINNPPEQFNLLKVADGATDVIRTPYFRWDHANDPEGDNVTYNLLVDESNPPLKKIARDISVNDFAIKDPLKYNTEYHWRVTARDSEGDSTSSDIFSFTTLTNLPPDPFNLMGVTDRAVNVSRTPTFRWNATTDPEGDSIWYNLLLGENESPSEIVAEGLVGTSFDIQEPLHLNTTYYWQIDARDNNGNSTTSNVFSFTTRSLSEAKLVTRSAQFSVRVWTSLVVFDNKLWIIGGKSPGSLFGKNDVWHSDNGKDWTLVTGNAGFSGRDSHATVVFDNKIWVIGGLGSIKKNDVWYSSDGKIWTEATNNAGFSGRYNHAAVVFDNRIWVIGQSDGFNNVDVWYSRDGENWTEATNDTGFSSRSTDAVVVFDNKIWVIGGSYNNDVWYSSDGETWTMATGNAGFSGRRSHATVVFDNKIWVIGGFDGSRKNDVWYSGDGENWMEATRNANFTERDRHVSTVFDNKIWIIAGSDGSSKNDVWYFE